MAKSKAKTLTQFRITGAGEAFTLHIEDDAGETLEFQATREQLDIIVEGLDDILSEDDA
jgi:hypothetical protein